MTDDFVSGLSQVRERIDQALDAWAALHAVVIKPLTGSEKSEGIWPYTLDTGWTVERLAPFYQMNEWEREAYLIERYADPFVARIGDLTPCASIVRVHRARSQHCICALGADVRVWLTLLLPFNPQRPGHVVLAGAPRVQETL